MHTILLINKEKGCVNVVGIPPEIDLMLDVGCADDPHGHVNCDLYQEIKHEQFGLYKDHVMHVRRIPNFVQCSAECLPFRDNAFTTIRCNQVLEHLPNWIQGLRELVRVSSDVIYWSVPAKELDWFPIMHLHFFHPRTITNVINFIQFQGEWELYNEIGEFICLMEKQKEVK